MDVTLGDTTITLTERAACQTEIAAFELRLDQLHAELLDVPEQNYKAVWEKINRLLDQIGQITILYGKEQFLLGQDDLTRRFLDINPFFPFEEVPPDPNDPLTVSAPAK
jgi:hypothetical protein